MKKRILIIGGSSGVGLELAKHYVADGHTVCATGDKDPNVIGLNFQELMLKSSSDQLVSDIDRVVNGFNRVNTLIYSAGFFQEGHIDNLSDTDIQAMVNVGLLAPALFIQRLKNNLETALKIMLITSSAQYTPREFEPVYCAVKAGLGMLGASLVKDQSIGKVLVVAPDKMNTNFRMSANVDNNDGLDPNWVAIQTVELSSGSFKYKSAKLLQNPARVEVLEALDSRLKPI